MNNRTYPAGVIAIILSLVQLVRSQRPVMPTHVTITNDGDTYHVSTDNSLQSVILSHRPDQSKKTDLRERADKLRIELASVSQDAAIRLEDEEGATSVDRKRLRERKNAGKRRKREIDAELATISERIANWSSRSQETFNLKELARQDSWVFLSRADDEAATIETSDRMALLESTVVGLEEDLAEAVEGLRTKEELGKKIERLNEDNRKLTEKLKEATSALTELKKAPPAASSPPAPPAQAEAPSQEAPPAPPSESNAAEAQ